MSRRKNFNKENENLSATEIAQKIKDGKSKRFHQLTKAEVEKEKRLENERASTISDVQRIVSVIIGIVFVSMPLSEHNIKWIAVGFITLFNTIWTIFYYDHNKYIMIYQLILNFGLVYQINCLENIPKMIAKIPPQSLAQIIIFSVIYFLFAYFLYIRKVKNKSERWDTAMVVYTILSLCIAFYHDLFTISDVKKVVSNFFRGLTIFVIRTF